MSEHSIEEWWERWLFHSKGLQFEPQHRRCFHSKNQWSLLHLGICSILHLRSVPLVGNIWYLSPLVLSKWEDLAFSVSRLFEKSVFILQFFNDKMHNYVKQNITKNFNIKKLNNKHTFLKTEKTKFSRWENLAFSVLRKVCLFFNFWIIKCTNVLNKT